MVGSAVESKLGSRWSIGLSAEELGVILALNGDVVC
jgi:hypothetical protein